MKNKNDKISIFKDKDDIKFLLTDDNIINVTGIIGSGKTTLAREIRNDTSFELISLDWMFGASLKNRPENIKKLSDDFEKLYPDKNKYKYADLIYKYLLANLADNKIFEGRHIYRYIDPKVFKGTLIIKRTRLINSYKRAFKRDMNNKIKEYKRKEIKFSKVLNRFFARIKFPILEYIRINNYINTLKENTKRDNIRK